MNDNTGYMFYDDICDIFKEQYMPDILNVERRQSEGCTNVKIDGPLRRQEWNNFTDALHKGGKITDIALNEWSAPDWLNPE